MIAGLVEFVLDIAAPLVAQVAEHFAQSLLVAVVVDLCLQRLIVSVAYVERRAIDVAAVWRDVLVVLAQLDDILLAPEHARDYNLLHGHVLQREAIHEVAPYVLQQRGGTGHEIRNAALQSAYLVEGVATNVYQLVLAPLGILNVLDWHNPVLLSLNQMYGVGVGSAVLVAPHAFNPVVYWRPIGVEEHSALGTRYSCLRPFAVAKRVGVGDVDLLNAALVTLVAIPFSSYRRAKQPKQCQHRHNHEEANHELALRHLKFLILFFHSVAKLLLFN